MKYLTLATILLLASCSINLYSYKTRKISPKYFDFISRDTIIWGQCIVPDSVANRYKCQMGDFYSTLGDTIDAEKYGYHDFRSSMNFRSSIRITKDSAKMINRYAAPNSN